MKADNIPPYDMLKASLLKILQDAELATNRAKKGGNITS